MPFINVKIAGVPIQAGQVAAIHADVTALMANVLGKRAELTAVLVEQVPADGWAVNGQAVSRAAHLDAKVTEGTNMPEEKSEFIAQAHAILRRIVGDLPTATYVVVHDQPADSWGYGGLTQGYRARTRSAVQP